MSLDKVIFLSNVRLSFPNLITPKVTKGDDGVEKTTYEADFLLPPDHPGFPQFWQLVNNMAAEKWKDHAANVMAMIQQDSKKRACYGLGDTKVNQKTFKLYDGYAGNYFIHSSRRDNRPQAIEDDGTPVDPANLMAYQAVMRKCYGGCYVNAAIKPWLQDHKQHGKGIRCDLVAVQFFKDGPAFGEGNIDASGLFTPVAPGVQQVAPGAMPPWMQQAPQAAPVAPHQPWGQPAAPAAAAMPWAAQAPQGMPPAPFPAPGVPQFGQ